MTTTLDFDVVAVSTALGPRSDVRARCEGSIAAQSIPVRHVYIDAAKEGGACLENVYRVVHSLDPSTVVLWVDGDDFLAHRDVAAIVLSHYLRGAWMTWGQYALLDGDRNRTNTPVCRDTADRRKCRKEAWYASHLRTFRAGLFQQIDRHDFFFEGKWNPECCDLTAMWPMLEMADNRGRFIKEVLYIYNDTERRARSHDDPRTLLGRRQQRAHAFLKTKRPYDRLDEPPWTLPSHLMTKRLWEGLKLPKVSRCSVEFDFSPKPRQPVRWPR